ncbi:hypothetical protein [Blastococcus sp. SYSU D00820]
MLPRLVGRVLRATVLTAIALALAVVLAPVPAHAAGLYVSDAPLRGSVVPAGSTVRLSAPGAVSVSWVLDGVYLGRDVAAPFELRLTTGPGEHKLKARSETRDGRKTTYQVRFTTVVAPRSPGSPGASSSNSVPAPPVAGTVPATPPTTAAAPSVAAPSSAPPAPATTPAPATAPAPATPAAPSPSSSPAPSAGAVRVATADQLAAALAAARPGQVIQLADGTYRGRFVVERSGTAAAPIVLRGGPGAVLDGGDAATGYTLHLDGADHWRVEGLTVRGGQKGVVLDEADSVVLSGLDVGHTGMEAVHFRTSSSDNRLEASAVHDTGLVEPGFGEGVYIGSATSNWGRYGEAGGPDRSDRNVVTGNRIYAVTAENVDVKEGTTGGVISGNTFDGAGMTGDHYADSWIDLKGNDYLVAGNVGVHTLLDGFQTHVQLDGWGEGNVFSGNRLDVARGGVGINVHRGDASTGNRIDCDNVVTGPSVVLANVPCG